MQIGPHAPHKRAPLEHMFNASGECSFKFLKTEETVLQFSDLFQVKHSRHTEH